MSDAIALSRRTFLVIGAGLALGIQLPAPRATDTATIGAWVRIEPDGTVMISCPAAEMGQGSMTALPMILAEEMDLDWAQVRIEFSPADDEEFHNPIEWAHGIMLTLGSSSVSGYWDVVRRQGARARQLLLHAVARHWDVPADALATKPGVVVYAATGRRMSYAEAAAHVNASAPLPALETVALKAPADYRIIGRDLPRHDLPAKVRGAPVYSIDVRLPDLAYGAVARSPVLGGRVLGIANLDAARAATGVIAVAELPDAVGVVAASWPQARAAAESLNIEWSAVEAARGLDNAAVHADHARALDDPAVQGLVWQERGDVAAAFAAAAKTYAAEYETDYHTHAQLEPLNAVARYDGAAHRVEIWAGTQAPTHCTRAVAAALELPVAAVTLHRTQLGGAFGRRGAQDHDYVCDAARLARVSGRPVQLIWSREQDLRAARMKPLTVQRLRAAEDASGRLVAWTHRVASDEPHRQADPYRFEKNRRWPVIAGLGINIPYGIEHVRCEVIVREMPVRIAPLRGVGASLNRFAAEGFLDEIALARGVDPLDFRLRLLGDDPIGRGVLEAVAELSGWRRRPPGAGMGVAFSAGETALGVVARVAVDTGSGAIRVEHVWVALDVGTAVHPQNIRGQVEGAVVYAVSNALAERITLRDGAVVQHNFDAYPLLRMRDAPAVDIVILEANRRPTGVGDIAPVAVPAAIGNAFAAATGQRLRRLPMTPAAVKAALA